MRRLGFLLVGLALATTLTACGPPAGTLQAAAQTLGTANMRSIEYSGTGRWFQFGQAPSPTLAWPQHDVSAYTAAINFDTSSARVEMTRKQTIEPGRARPAPAEVEAGSVGERHLRMEPRHASRRPSRHGADGQRGARGRRRAGDGDLVHAARLRQSRARQQRDVDHEGHRL